MAKSKSPTKKLTDAINELTAHIKSTATESVHLDKALLDAETSSGKQRRELQQTNLNLAQTNQNLDTDIKGLTLNFFRLHSMLAGNTKRNDDLAKTLVKNNIAREDGMRRFTQSADTGRASLTQAIDVFGDMTELGMGGFERATLHLGTDLKILGVSVKSAMMSIRQNTQMLGIGEEQSRAFVDSLVSTAAQNRSSIGELIEAMNAFKDELLKISVDLGPEQALQAQKAAAALSQGNSAMFEPAMRLITSLVAGTEGFVKAGILGSPFSPGMSDASFTDTLEKSLRGIQRMDPGTGNVFMTQALSDQLGLTHENLQVVRMLGVDIGKLVEGQSDMGARAVTRNSFTQGWQNALFDVQSEALDFLKTIANTINALGPLTQFLIGGALVRGLGGIFKGIAKNPGGAVLEKMDPTMLPLRKMSPTLVGRGVGLAAKLTPLLLGPVGLALAGAATAFTLFTRRGQEGDTAGGTQMTKYQEMRAAQEKKALRDTENIEKNTKISSDYHKDLMSKAAETKSADSNLTSLLERLLFEAREQSRLKVAGNDVSERLLDAQTESFNFPPLIQGPMIQPR